MGKKETENIKKYKNEKKDYTQKNSNKHTGNQWTVHLFGFMVITRPVRASYSVHLDNNFEGHFKRIN